MKHHVCAAVVALLAVGPMLAQAPNGWKVRVDHSMMASDPDAAGADKLVATGSGFHAINPQAAVYWNPANTVAGNYSLKGTFTQIRSDGFEEYYGLVFGGSGLEGPAQSYLYFMVSDNGTWLVKRRNGNATEEVAGRTPNDAVKKADASGKCTNALEVRVMADKVEFLVNGGLVRTLPKTGPAAKTDGIYGFRINHRLEVRVDGFGVSKL